LNISFCFGLQNQDLTKQVIETLERKNQTWFTPSLDCENAICFYLDTATSTIDIAMYNLTNPRIIDSIKFATDRNVKVRIFLDKSMKTTRYEDLNILKEKDIEKDNLEIRIYKKSGYMHNKYAIIDRKVVLIGSYNYTDHANKNAENLHTETNYKQIEVYQDNFDKLWNE